MNKAELEELRQLYSLEEYLFKVVSPKFKNAGYLTAFDFFCIVIWKANRAKSKVALRLFSKDPQKRCNLEEIVNTLTTSISNAKKPEERLRILIEDWGFRLPMTTAILTVLYPHEFTIYDVRVCEVIGKYSDLKNKTKIKSIWPEYQEFRKAVQNFIAEDFSMRDKDRILWAKSFRTQLEGDIECLFSKSEPDEEV